MLLKLLLVCIASAQMALLKNVFVDPSKAAVLATDVAAVTGRKLTKIAAWDDAAKAKFDENLKAIKAFLDAKKAALETADYEKIESFYNDLDFVMNKLRDEVLNDKDQAAPKDSEVKALMLELTKSIYDAFHTADRAFVKGDPQLILFMADYWDSFTEQVKKLFGTTWIEASTKFPTLATPFDNVHKFYHLFQDPSVNTSVGLETFIKRKVEKEEKTKVQTFLNKAALEKVKQAGVDIAAKVKDTKDEKELKKLLSDFDEATADFVKELPVIVYTMLAFEKFDVVDTKDMVDLLGEITAQYKNLFSGEDKDFKKKMTDGTAKTAEQLKVYHTQYMKADKDKQIKQYFEDVKVDVKLETVLKNLDAAATAHPAANTADGSNLTIIIIISIAVVLVVVAIIAVAVYFLRKNQ